MTGKAYNNRCIAEWLHNVTERHWRQSSDPRAPLAHLLMSLCPFKFQNLKFCSPNNFRVLFWPNFWLAILCTMFVCHDFPTKEWYHTIFRNYGAMSSFFVPGIALFDLRELACDQCVVFQTCLQHLQHRTLSGVPHLFISLLYCLGPHNRRQLLTRLA